MTCISRNLLLSLSDENAILDPSGDQAGMWSECGSSVSLETVNAVDCLGEGVRDGTGVAVGSVRGVGVVSIAVACANRVAWLVAFTAAVGLSR